MPCLVLQVLVRQLDMLTVLPEYPVENAEDSMADLRAQVSIDRPYLGPYLAPT